MQYAILDENGKIKNDQGPGSYRIRPEVVAEWNQKREEFDALPITIERHAVDLKDFDGAGLTPSDLLALDGVYVPLEDPEAKAKLEAVK